MSSASCIKHGQTLHKIKHAYFQLFEIELKIGKSYPASKLLNVSANFKTDYTLTKEL